MTRELARTSLAAAAETTVTALAIAGDDAAYGELVRRRQGQIRGLLRRLCRDASLADDLSQQAFLQAWRRLATLESPAAFGAWLRKVAVSMWLQYARSHPERSQEAAPEPAHEPLVGERLDLDRALLQLPDDARLCIVLAYSEGMSHREIAAATDMPLGTVKSHIARGSARLRDLLGAYA